MRVKDRDIRGVSELRTLSVSAEVDTMSEWAHTVVVFNGCLTSVCGVVEVEMYFYIFTTCLVLTRVTSVTCSVLTRVTSVTEVTDHWCAAER